MENPYIDIIGHPDDGRYPLDYERVVKAAKATKTLLEINNSSLKPSGFRLNTKENDVKMLKLCKQYRVPVILDSDAHFADDVGRMSYASGVVGEVELLASNCQYATKVVFRLSCGKEKSVGNFK